jgi:hypothetical protein
MAKGSEQSANHSISLPVSFSQSLPRAAAFVYAGCATSLLLVARSSPVRRLFVAHETAAPPRNSSLGRTMRWQVHAGFDRLPGMSYVLALDQGLLSAQAHLELGRLAYGAKDLDGALCVELAEHLLRGAQGARALPYLGTALTYLERNYLNDRAIALADRGSNTLDRTGAYVADGKDAGKIGLEHRAAVGERHVRGHLAPADVAALGASKGLEQPTHQRGHCGPRVKSSTWR